jgi:PST family polysaccharide transporter
VLLENFLSLFFLQIANYAAPLITIPYLVRILGPEVYGIVSAAQYLIQYFVILTDYGFNFSATRLISIHREDPNQLSRIFSSVMYIKIMLLIMCFLLLLLVLYLYPRYGEFWPLYLITFSLVAGNVLFPQWLFQGLEKMKFISIINVITKLMFLEGIFIFIQTEDDYLWVPILLGLGYVVSGIIALIYIFFRLHIRFTIPDRKDILWQLKDGWHLFLSTISATLYINSNGFLLDIITQNPVWVGYYAAGEKVVRAITAAFIPLTTALYPFITKKIYENKEAGVRLFFKFLKWIAGGAFVASVLTFVLSENLSSIVLGEDFSESASVIKILAVIPFFGTIGSMVTYQLFINIGLKHVITRILIVAFSIDLILNFVLIPQYGFNGAAIALAVTEVFCPLAFLGYYFYRRTSQS